MFVSNHGEPLHQVGVSISLHLDAPLYVGIGLSSHNPALTEKATFSNIEIKPLAPPATPAQMVLYSTVQAIGVEDNFRRAIVINSRLLTLRPPTGPATARPSSSTRTDICTRLPQPEARRN